MKSKLIWKIIGGAAGFVIGIIGGGYLGLVLGGTLLGGFDIYQQTGMEGYELASYIGAVIGALLATPWGIRLALKVADRKKS